MLKTADAAALKIQPAEAKELIAIGNMASRTSTTLVDLQVAQRTELANTCWLS